MEHVLVNATIKHGRFLSVFCSRAVIVTFVDAIRITNFLNYSKETLYWVLLNIMVQNPEALMTSNKTVSQYGLIPTNSRSPGLTDLNFVTVISTLPLLLIGMNPIFYFNT
jgi:hypothetical protein